MEKQLEGRKNRFSEIIKALKINELKDVPCFFEKAYPWGASEELILLAALETYGYGNWDPITEVLNIACKKGFTPFEVQCHYNDIYLEGDIAKEIQKVKIEPLKSTLVDHFGNESDDILNCRDMSAHLNLPKRFLQKIGYMPLRRDFEMECKPDAELILKRVKFKADMDDFDKNLNLLILDTYNNKVKERYMKKKVISAHRIAECYYEMRRGKKNGSANGVAKNQKSKFSLNTLAELFPTCAKRNFYLNLTKEPQTRKKEHVIRTHAIDENMSTLRRSSRTPKPTMKKLSSECNSKASSVASGSRRQLRSKRKEEKLEDMDIEIDLTLSGSESDEESSKFEQSFEDIATDGTHVLFKYPWVEYLSNKERKLCVDLELEPVQYIYYKAFLLREDITRRQGYAGNNLLMPPDMTSEQCIEIAKFLLEVGLIKSISIFESMYAEDVYLIPPKQ